jgi:hypothetical protein
MEQSYCCLHFMISGSKLIGRRTLRVYILRQLRLLVGSQWPHILNACDCFYDMELQGTSMPDERHFHYKEVSQK